MGAFLGGDLACCCGGGGGSECTNCNGSTGPTYFTVVISGVTGTCHNSPSSSYDRNGTYVVSYAYESGGVCYWICSDTGMRIEIGYDSGAAKYYISVFLSQVGSPFTNNAAWKKEYVSAPTCSTLSSESISFDFNVGSCDASSSTCTITAGDSGAYYCCSNACSTGTRHTSQLQVVVAGFANSAYCSECTDLNATYTLDFDAVNCEWNYDFPSTICADCTGFPPFPYEGVSVRVTGGSSDAGAFYLQMGTNTWANDTLDSREWNCETPEDYDAGLEWTGSPLDPVCCDISSVTFTITVI